MNMAKLKGEVVSDNSFFLLQLKFGLVFTVGLLLFSLWLINVYFVFAPFFLFWFVISLATTNSLLWDSYILLAISTLKPRKNLNSANSFVNKKT